MARVVRFHETGGPEVLKIEQLDVPPPGKGEVQIRVKALGLNRAESMFRRGEYLEQPDFPARIGYEAAGTVAAVGPGVDGFQVGDAVSTIPAFSMNQYGVYGDFVNAPRPGPGPPPGLALLGAGGLDVDAIPDRLRSSDRHRRPESGRYARDPRGLEQRRPGRHPDRQPGGCDSHRPDPQELEEAGPAGRGRDPCRRDRRTGPGQGNPRPDRWQGRPGRLRPRGRPDHGEARGGHDAPRHRLHLRGLESGADDCARLGAGGQVHRPAWLLGAGDHARPDPTGAWETFRQRGPG